MPGLIASWGKQEFVSRIVYKQGEKGLSILNIGSVLGFLRMVGRLSLFIKVLLING
jgi:hypothetical protein